MNKCIWNSLDPALSSFRHIVASMDKQLFEVFIRYPT